MSIKNWNAGIIRPVPVAPAGPYQDGAAPGVWTLDQVAYWQKQGLWPTAGRIAFGNVVTYSTATGDSYETFVVPAGVTVLRVQGWGAGGGSSETVGSSFYATGGGGGYAQCDIAVTPGESLRIYVGQPGQFGPGNYYGQGGSGGGYSGVFRGTTPLMIAGGGGGTAYISGYTSSFTAGHGGGSTGGDGESITVSSTAYTGGRGGTQTEGGASVCTTRSTGGPWSCSGAGGYLQGGIGGSLGTTGQLAGGAPGGGTGGGYTTVGTPRNGGGGGGGGGYYGGSGGSGSRNDDQTRAASGGGGSCYVTGTNTTMLQGESYPSVIRSSNANYVSPCGRGGYNSAGAGPIAEAERGLVVVSYSS